MGELPLNINIEEPRWDQSTFLGRARHFFTVTDPRNLLLSGAQLEASRNIVQNYRAGVLAPGLTEDQLWRPSTCTTLPSTRTRERRWS